MRYYTILVVATVSPLALLVPSGAMAKVTHGIATCSGAEIVPMGNGFGCVKPLKVGPPGTGGGAGPSDWGMCGALSVSGDFGPPTVARIVVDTTTGLYGVKLVGASPSVVPTMDWTCVLFADFQGVPPVSDATYFEPTSFKGAVSESAVSTEVIKGSAGNACIWAGLAGNLEYVFPDGGIYGESSAEFDDPQTSFGAENVTSFAFCSSYSLASWTGWIYLQRGPTFFQPPPGGESIGQNQTQDWCYMDKMQVLIRPDTGSVGPISAGLTISSTGEYSIFADPQYSVAMGFNCLPLTQ